MNSYFTDREIFLINLNPPLLFILILLRSSILAIQIKEPLILWFLIEINTIRIIILSKNENNKNKIITFFIYQTISSLAFLLYITFINQTLSLTPSSFIILIAILIKIGSYPFFFWIISLSKSLSWTTNIIIITWQKIIPIAIIFKTLSSALVTPLIIFLLIPIALIFIKITNIKAIFITSSLMHTRWIIIPSSLSPSLPITYLFIYSLIIIPLIKLFFSSNFTYSSYSKTSFPFINLFVSSFRIAGIPPFTGFILKIAIILTVLKSLLSIWLLLLLFITSSISFFTYFVLSSKFITFPPANSSSSIRTPFKKIILSNKINFIIPTAILI